VNEYEVIVSQEESLASLITYEILRSMPELKIVVISDNFEELR
jgi:hypothetical protein